MFMTQYRYRLRATTLSVLSMLPLSACLDNGGPDWVIPGHTVSTNAGAGGGISPATAAVEHGSRISFNITPDEGYSITQVTGCGGLLSGTTYTSGAIVTDCTVNANFSISSHTITAKVGVGGNVSPPSTTINHGNSTSFIVTPDTGYDIDRVKGCNGLLSGTTYTTGPVTEECTITANFVIKNHTVTASAGTGGSITPTSISVAYGGTLSFTLNPDSGYNINNVTGCNGSLSGTTYTTAVITSDCAISTTFIRKPPATAATLSLTFIPTKNFRFSWTDVADATHYRLLENPDGSSGYAQVGGDIPAGIQNINHYAPLHARINGQYILQSCNDGGCTDSPILSVSGTLTESIGYFKASNTGASDQFGYAVALSGDGDTLAVGAPAEDSNTTGVNNGSNNSAANSGAVYIFARSSNSWSQQAFIKASNTGAGDRFGYAVDLSDDGNILAVGAYREDSNTSGINGVETNNSATDSGAVYLFTRNDSGWTQQTYVKASNTGANDNFGYTVVLSGDGHTLAVGAPAEDSATTGVNGDENNDSAADSGAVYLFTYSGGNWSQQAYIKANNSGAGDQFGSAIDLSKDGNTLAAGALEEDSNATGINGDENNNSRSNSGAVYLFTRSGNSWNQQTYVKANNAGAGDGFGHAVALSGDGRTLAVGAWGENSAAYGINGDGSNNSAADSGAVYLFTGNSSNWQQQAYLKAGNSNAGDRFGWSISLSSNGDTLAVGARLEDSNATGINGDEADNSMSGAGAAFLFTRRNGGWNQQSYIKASNTGTGDQFGRAISLSDNADTLAVTGYREDSNATGVNGDAANDARSNSGAVYLY